MAFAVESGTGSSDSNSYVSLVYADSYFKDSGKFAWPHSLYGSWTLSSGGTISGTDYDLKESGIQVGYKIIIDSSTNSGTWTVSSLSSVEIGVTETLASTSSTALAMWFVSAATYFSGVGIDAQKKRKLTQATQWIDGTYANEFAGIRYSTGQSLEWPRSGAVGQSGYFFEENEVPEEVKRATCEAAYLLGTGTTLNETSEEGLQEYTVSVGPISEQKIWRGQSSKKKAYDVIRNAIYNALKMIGFRRVTI